MPNYLHTSYSPLNLLTTIWEISLKEKGGTLADLFLVLLNLLIVSVALILKTVNWFAQQINSLASDMRATMATYGLSGEYVVHV